MSSVHERLVGQLARIKELSGLSLRALASKAGLSSSSLSRYLTGQLVPPWEAVVALCRVVGRDPRPLRALWAEAAKAGAEPSPRRNDLPADLADFTGREAELERVAELLRTASAVAIDGMAGVGKTSLAVHVAHRLAPSFPDGGLYLDLQGFTPGQQPLEPPAALERLLGALGVSHLPTGTAERAALWRSELSRRQALVVLDNAIDAEHVRPLLPGAGKSAVLVTSRNRLVDLDGVPPVSVEPLSNADAATLFGQAAGVNLTGEKAAAQVLRECGGLPLALRMAGARLRHRPGWTVAVLAERLRDSTSRFDTVFGMSLKQLDSDQRRMFRLLGVLPGTDFDAPAAGALTGMTPDRVNAVLEELVDAHLAQEPSPGRFRLHDLIRRYAADIAADEEPQADAAVRRVLNHYLAQAIAHDRTLPVQNRKQTLPGDPAEVAKAVAWFDTEYPNLIACFDAAVQLGADEVVAELPPAMRAWFFRHRGTDDQVRLLEAASAAAQRLGRNQQRASLLADLGFAHAAAGRLVEALATYELAEQSGLDDDDLAAGLALRTGFVLRDLGQLESAQAHFRLAHHVFEKTGHRSGQSQALAFDGWVTLHLGRHHEAAEIARASVALADGPAQITGLVTLGVALASEDAAESRKTLQEALQLAEVPHTKAWCHNYFGVALRIMGSLDEALEQHRRAFELLEPLAEAQLEIDFLPTYAETCRVAGLTDEAVALHERTIELARKLGRPNDEKLAREARQRLTEHA